MVLICVSGVSEYEQHRLANIARNEDMLRQLKIQPLPMAATKPVRAKPVRGVQAVSRRSKRCQPVINYRESGEED